MDVAQTERNVRGDKHIRQSNDSMAIENQARSNETPTDNAFANADIIRSQNSSAPCKNVGDGIDQQQVLAEQDGEETYSEDRDQVDLQDGEEDIDA